jgi:uncharacterized protein YggU (UPF0235/DUF167 family)
VANIAAAAALTFGVRLTPRAGVDRIEGVDAHGELGVKVRAAPAEGSANAALVRLVADVLQLPKGAVSLVRGRRSRTKVVAVVGIEAAALARRWPGLVVGRKS